MRATPSPITDTIEIEVRLLNVLACLGRGHGHIRALVLPMGSTVIEAVKKLQIPMQAIFNAWCNGQDITRALFHEPADRIVLQNGDILALSGYPKGCNRVSHI